MDTYETIDLNDYTQIGEGGNGKTYVTSADSDEILKVNNARLNTWEAEKLFFGFYVHKLMKQYYS